MAYNEQTLTGAVYLQDFRAEPCQVCGENASGWHCGSITCEACKKFFLRSVNGEYLKYRCIRDQQCPITRTTRTQCQFCRYSKCIVIGMKLTEESANPKIEEIFRGIPCAVCQDASSGIHFGAMTCESCKGFFRRMIKERIPHHYKCLERNNCEVTTTTRNLCRACRFHKCLTAGMSIEGSRIGRQSNLFKHKMVEMQRRGLIQSQLLQALTSNLNQSRKKTTVGREASSSYTQSTSRSHFEDSLQPELLQQLCAIENAYVQHLKDLPVCSTETMDLWSVCLAQLNDYSNRVRDFIDGIISFNLVPSDDKTALTHSSTHSVILMCFCIQSARSGTLNNTWNYLNIPSDTPSHPYFQHRFAFLFELPPLLRSLEKELQILDLNDKEIALMLTLLITSIGSSHHLLNNLLNSSIVGNEKCKAIEEIEEEYFAALYDYMTAKRGPNSKDYFILTIQIPLVHRINKLITSHINHLQCSLSYAL